MNIRLSYSVMNRWLTGDYDGAIEALQGNWGEPNRFMEEGLRYHKEWEEEVKKTGRLPSIFGGQEIDNPHTEVWGEKKVLDWLTIVGKVDLIYGDKQEILVDYKTGSSTASAYGSSLQHKVYKILFPEAKYFDYLHYNQYTRTVSMIRVHLTDKILEDGLNTIVTVGCDIRATLENMGIELNDKKG